MIMNYNAERLHEAAGSFWGLALYLVLFTYLLLFETESYIQIRQNIEFIFLTKLYAMKTYGGVTSALVGGEKSSGCNAI
jgi:hypothetical protein